MSDEAVFQAQAAVQPDLLNKPNVVGVAVGYKVSQGQLTDEIAIVALVEKKKPPAALSALELIPRILEGYRTDVLEVGTLEAQQTPRDRYRPLIPAGASIGHFKVTAGTIGALVRDNVTGETLILSNNHVLANCNDAQLGDAILQPGTIDGGLVPGDVVAQLVRYAPLRYQEDAGRTLPPTLVGAPNQPTTPVTPTVPTTPAPGTTGQGCDVVGFFAWLANTVAALNGSSKRVVVTQGAQTAGTTGGTVSVPTLTPAQQAELENPLDGALARPVDARMFNPALLTIGQVSGTKPVTLGMRVRKVGRTSGYTEGSVTLVNATVNVAYNTAAGKKTARFTGQVLTQSMSQGGDSGSLVVDALENRAVGLLFAGSSAATIFTPIDRVLAALGVTLL